MDPAQSERLQKIISRHGYGSRRQAEEFIREGRVTINGKLAQLGQSASSADAIKVDGKLLTKAEAPVYLAFHKPSQVICQTSDSQGAQTGRKTLVPFLKGLRRRVFPVGRIDFNGSGLVLLTNDGTLSAKINRSPVIVRSYEVKFKGHFSSKEIERLRKGGTRQGKLFRPTDVQLVKKLKSKTVMKLAFTGSGSIDIKEFLRSRGFLVEEVKRVQLGHLSLSGIPKGRYKTIERSSAYALVQQPELGTRLISRSTKVRSLQGVVLALGLMGLMACEQSKTEKSSRANHEQIVGDRIETARSSWDRFFNREDYVYGRRPTPFLEEVIGHVPVGRALVLAMGEGRDAVFLARKGFQVEGVDISEVALRKARRLAREYQVKVKTIQANLKNYTFPTDRYDLIVNFVYFRKDLIPKIKKALRPGGVAVFQNYTTHHLQDRGGLTIPKRFLVKKEELKSLFRDFELISYREGFEEIRREPSEKAFVASLVARKSSQF